MELYIDRDALLVGLGRVQGIVERRNTPNPVLAHCLLEASDSRLRLTATDTELAYIGDIPANVVAPGEITVDAQALFQIAKVMPEPTLRMNLAAQNRLEVSSGTAWYKVTGGAAEDFPGLPDFDGRCSLRLRAGQLRWLIERTAFVVSSEDSRYGLNGAHLEVVDGNDGRPVLRMVATDGHRLSYAQVPFEGEFGMSPRMLVSRKALAEMKKLFDRDDEEIEMGFGENAALITTGASRFYFRLVDGEFPDYRQVVPTRGQRKVVVSREALLGALRRVAIFAVDKNRPVRFAFKDASLVITGTHADLGTAREEVPVDLQGGPLEMGFNIRYAMEVLSVLTAPKVVFELGDPLSPALLKEPDRDDGLVVIMPMRLD